MEAYKFCFVGDGKLFIDGSHIKANANNHKYQDEQIEKTARAYEEELQREITTDPESGYFHNGEHKQVFTYVTNTYCDRHDFVLDFEVTAGNVHNRVSFFELYKRLKERKNPKYYVIDT